MSPFALASHSEVGRCDGSGVALGVIELGGPYGSAPVFYVDDRNYLLGNGMWTYEETNGIYAGDTWRNLQRGGTSFIVPDDDEVCIDDPTVSPDTLIM